mmetsp:Transcript_31786/g.76975  ORF Transcript_31786/g.76975 Transcript_31786/m.76975 type:complete len:99 (+) Transcript_31786:1262-1558(+)
MADNVLREDTRGRLDDAENGEDDEGNGNDPDDAAVVNKTFFPAMDNNSALSPRERRKQRPPKAKATGEDPNISDNAIINIARQKIIVGHNIIGTVYGN